MNSFKSLKVSVGEQQTSIIAEVAHRVGIVASLAYKWTRPQERPGDDDCSERGSGRRNPVDILKRWIEACLTLGRPRKNALAPLDHLEHHFNRIAIDIPEKCRTLSPADLATELIKAMKEFGDVVAEYQAADSDKQISRKELSRIEPAVWEAGTQLMVFLHCAREAAVGTMNPTRGQGDNVRQGERA